MQLNLVGYIKIRELHNYVNRDIIYVEMDV